MYIFYINVNTYYKNLVYVLMYNYQDLRTYLI